MFCNKAFNEEINQLKPPNPKKIPKEFSSHGIKRVDNYFWMRDDSRKNQEVIKHLEEENNYLDSWFQSSADKRDEIFKEIISRIPKKEDSVPVRMGSYEYFRRYDVNK